MSSECVVSPGKNAGTFPRFATTDDTDTTDKKTDYYCLIRGVREIRGCEQERGQAAIYGPQLCKVLLPFPQASICAFFPFF